jgi:hypothetical protein
LRKQSRSKKRFCFAAPGNNGVLSHSAAEPQPQGTPIHRRSEEETLNRRKQGSEAATESDAVSAYRRIGVSEFGRQPAAADAPATPERPIATTPLAMFTSFGSLRRCLRQSGIPATASVGVHPRAGRAQAECPAECLRYPGARDIASFVCNRHLEIAVSQGWAVTVS